MCVYLLVVDKLIWFNNDCIVFRFVFWFNKCVVNVCLSLWGWILFMFVVCLIILFKIYCILCLVIVLFFIFIIRKLWLYDWIGLKCFK